MTEHDRFVPISPAAFRDALGLFPTGVVVVTARSPSGDLFGVTVNSFNSVSLDPPLILFSLSRNLLSLQLFLSAEAFAISILQHGQSNLSVQFSRASGDKWRNVEHRAGRTGSPVIERALAVIECVPYANYEAGDHVIVVGRVIHVETNPHDEPLVFFRGNYSTVSRSGR